MRRSKKNKLDVVGIGLLTGITLPLIVFFVVYLAGNNSVSFGAYIKSLFHLQALIKLGSLCVFANLAAFWVFLQMKYEKAARGVLGATLLYAFVVLISRAL
jgi:hypothetical protein